MKRKEKPTTQHGRVHTVCSYAVSSLLTLSLSNTHSLSGDEAHTRTQNGALQTELATSERCTFTIYK